MMTKNVLGKGQIVIPKVIRNLLGIDIGDELTIDVDNDNIILSKKNDVVEVFLEVSQKSSRKISMKDLKKELEARYSEA